MDITQKIKLAVKYKNTSMTELAAALNMTPQAMYQRLKTGKFTSAELEKIAVVLGAVYNANFEFPDGFKI